MATCSRRSLIRFLLVAVGVLLLVQLACTDTESNREDQLSRGNEDQSSADNATLSTETPAPIGVLQSSEDAAAEDAALVAEARGWTLEEVAIYLRASEVMDGIAEQLTAERPDVFIGGALAEEPDGAPTIYIKGPAGDFVLGLVATAEIEIKIVDHQPYSLQELDERQTQVTLALRALGFQNFAVGSDIQARGKIIAEVTRQDGLPDDPDEILAGLPDDLRDSVELTVSDDPVVVDL